MAIGKVIASQEVPTSLATIYTSPNVPGSKTDIRSISVVNRDENNDGWIRLYRVAPGGTAGDGNILIPDTKQFVIPKGRRLDYETWKVMEPQWTLQLIGSSQLTIHIDGAFVT